VTTLREAAALLARTDTFRDLPPLAAALGFGSVLPLDAHTRAELGVDADVRHAAIASGSGTLRALLLDVIPEANARAAVARAAHRAAARSPQLLWIVLAIQRASHTAIVAVPSSAARQRIAALTFDTRRIVDSDAETFAALTHAARGHDLLVHHRWRELLGRDALTRRFYRALEQTVHDLAATARGSATERVRRELALLCTSRLLFLAFLEAKNWLDGDRAFLRNHFDDLCAKTGDVHRRLLDPLFFGTLNTPFVRRAPRARALGRIPFLNGGLFARTPLEKRSALRFTDDALGALIGGLLGKYRVTAREASTAWSEAAVDPEMLGRAFESLMASDDRRAAGAFYTPLPIIERVGDVGIEETLARLGAPVGIVRAARTGTRLSERARQQLCSALCRVRVLDPACGSGSFLVYALEQLADLSAAAGDRRPTSDRRRDILTRSIFGVDINPTAVWLCELRLWLSVVIDSGETDPLAVPPLPNLDRHIRIGDALAGAAFEADGLVSAPAALVRLRSRYANSTGVRKRALARELDRDERRRAIAQLEQESASVAARRRDVLCAARSRDLFDSRTTVPTALVREADALRAQSRSLRRRLAALRSGGALPFSFAVHFGDAAARGGFDCIIGNPPWVRLHNIPADTRESLRQRFRAFRDASWTSGAAEAGAGKGFASQADLAALFIERSLALTRPGGVTALLVPAKLWRSLAGGGVRRVVAESSSVIALDDWTESRAAFDAAVYPSMIVAAKEPASSNDIHITIHRRDNALDWELPHTQLPLDDSPGAPWLLLPPEVRAGFDSLAAHGTPLARSVFGRPLLGVKTGCNEAFLVPRTDSAIEASMRRPVLRGEAVRAWRPDELSEEIIWTHDAHDRPRTSLPAAALRHLVPWRRRLEARTDSRSGAAWWPLFRTESARTDVARVVWSDIGKEPRALVLDAGDRTVPLNSCYVARAPSRDDALTLAAILNSPLAAAWLAAIAEPARGGYQRYLGWTVARLPLPRDWAHAVKLLAPIAQSAIDGAPPDRATLTDLTIRAYRMKAADVSPLLVWCLR
jgi:hypothetical protein